MPELTELKEQLAVGTAEKERLKAQVSEAKTKLETLVKSVEELTGKKVPIVDTAPKVAIKPTITKWLFPVFGVAVVGIILALVFRKKK